MEQERADTVPGFTMQSENFYLKFITGLQCGVSSRLLEYETDWYEVMEIILSRLQDEQEDKERFEVIASRDLEYWAKMQPGGDSLNLKIRVMLEEKRYFEPPAGSRKALRLVFNDRFSTQVLFHVRKKVLMRSLVEIAAVSVADLVAGEETLPQLRAELPGHLIPEVRRALHNCWTPRFFRTKIVRAPCPASCSCRNKVLGYSSYVAQLASQETEQPAPGAEAAEEPIQELVLEPEPSTSSASLSTSSSSSNPSTSAGPNRRSSSNPRKSISRKSKTGRSQEKRRRSARTEEKSRECEKCSSKEKVSTRSSCDSKENNRNIRSSTRRKVDKEEASTSSAAPGKYIKGLKVKIRQLHVEIEDSFTSLVMKVKGRKRKAEERVESKKRKSSRLNALKESLRELSRGRKREAPKDDIFEPRPSSSSSKTIPTKVSKNKSLKRLTSKSKTDASFFKRTLRSQVLDSSATRKKRRLGGGK